jgi:dynein heavy chain
MGLHDNAIIQQAMNEANTIFQNTLKLTESSSSNDRGSGEDSNSLVSKMTQDILDTIREPFKIKEVEKKYPFTYEESMNSVLLQELARYNTLIETIRESLKVLIMTLEGKLVSNAETDELLTSIKSNSIPEKWRKKSYPSMKTLLGYVEDLK